MKEQHEALAARVLPGAGPRALTMKPFATDASPTAQSLDSALSVRAGTAGRVGVASNCWWQSSRQAACGQFGDVPLPINSTPEPPRGTTPGRPPPPRVESTGTGVTLRRARGRVLGGKVYSPAAPRGTDLMVRLPPHCARSTVSTRPWATLTVATEPTQVIEPSYFNSEQHRVASQLEASSTDPHSFDYTATSRPRTQMVRSPQPSSLTPPAAALAQQWDD
jgi:hypothetical protein